MSDAQSVENKLDGAVNGQPWAYRIVNLSARTRRSPRTAKSGANLTALGGIALPVAAAA